MMTRLLFIYNRSTIYLTKNSEFHSRTKNIDVQCHFVRKCMKYRFIEIQHILSYVVTSILPVNPFHITHESLSRL